MLTNNQAVQVDCSLLPEVEMAVQDFESKGGQLTHFSSFGKGPLHINPTLVTQRKMEFSRRFPNISEFFHTVVNGDYIPFRGITRFNTNQ